MLYLLALHCITELVITLGIAPTFVPCLEKKYVA